MDQRGGPRGGSGDPTGETVADTYWIGGGVNRGAGPAVTLTEEDGGKVTIRTGQTDGRSTLTWTEAGGPKIDGVPTRRGFGWTLIGMMLDQIGARIERRWEPGGLIVRMQMEV